MTIVYASIGNSDDKLTQARWSTFQRAFVAAIRMHVEVIHGEWYSAPTAPFESACVCFEIDPGAETSLWTVLANLAGEYEQESIAWATASPGFITAGRGDA
ncbi:hypothetical protein ACFVH6_22050 [Spirillospora sp. NPDC127200]